MKIENCHPKIEDRIDLRLCPQEQDVWPSEQIILKSLTFSLRNGGHNGAMSCQLKSNEDECKSQSVEK